MALTDSPTIAPAHHSNGRASSPADAVKSTATALSLVDGGDVGVTAIPTGFQGLRRAATINEGSESRRRSGSFIPGNTDFPTPFRGARRRSSTFSDYSLSEARRNFDQDIINPGSSSRGAGHKDEVERSGWSSLPLAFAIVPAVAGILFNNGSAVITDVLLLGLASVFLNWTVTSPIKWYRTAQQFRVREESMVEVALEDSGEGEPRSSSEPNTPTNKSRGLDDVPEEQQTTQSRPQSHLRRECADQTRKALKELYRYEIVALLCCFACPILGAVLLHYIRDQLSRPAEGLVSNFNLVIFALAAEVWPCSLGIKLVMARTLHLQRVVSTNPYRADVVTSTQMQEVLKRLKELEAREVEQQQQQQPGMAAAADTVQNGNSVPPGKSDAKIVREVRNLIQPELDALNRAVRRYEKKATVLAFQTESRMGALDMRLNDAIALAAAATKHNKSDWGVVAWMVDWAVWAIWLPFSALMAVVLWPARTVAGWFGYGSSQQRGRNRSKKRHSGVVSQWERERGSGSGSGGDMRRGGMNGAAVKEKMAMGGQRMGPSSSSSSDRLLGRFRRR